MTSQPINFNLKILTTKLSVILNILKGIKATMKQLEKPKSLGHWSLRSPHLRKSAKNLI